MKKMILWISAMFLLALPLVNAQLLFNNTPIENSSEIIWADFAAGCTFSSTGVYCIDADAWVTPVMKLPNLTRTDNFTIYLYNFTFGGDDAYDLMVKLMNKNSSSDTAADVVWKFMYSSDANKGRTADGNNDDAVDINSATENVPHDYIIEVMDDLTNFYVDGNKETSINWYASNAGDPAYLILGTKGAAGTWINATGIAICNGTQELANYCEPTVAAAADLETFTVTCLDLFDDSALNNITLNVFNSSDSFSFNTVNGTIYIQNRTIEGFDSLYNITFAVNDSGGYFNYTYADINITDSGSLEGKLYQSILRVNASEIISLNKIFSFGIVVNGSSAINFSNSSGYAKILIKAGVYNLTGNSSGYFNSTSNKFTISALEDKNYSIDFYSHKLKIDAKTLVNGSYISLFTARLTKNSSSYSANDSTTTGNVTFNLIAGDYVVSLISDYHANQNASLTLVAANNLPNYTFSLYTWNSINFSIFDELIGKSDLFNESAVTLEVVSATFSQNYTVTNGTIYVDLLDPMEYRISYDATGYTKRDYYFTMVNRTHSNIDLYLLSTTNSTDTTFTAQDENAQIVTNATIQMLRYYVDSNSYVIVAMSRTDSNGQARINLDQFDAFYYFVVQKGGSTILITNPSRVITNEITLNTIVGEDVLKSRKEIRDVSYSLTYSNLTDQIRFVYSDSGSIVDEGCLLVERITNTNTIEVCNSCTSSTSSTILCTINSSLSGFHRAFGIIHTTTKNSPYILEQLDILASKVQEGISRFGNMGLYLTSYLVMALALLALPIPWLSVLFSIIGIVFAGIVGILGIGYTAMMAVVILGAIIIYKTRS